MATDRSRRNFLAAGLALPAVGLGAGRDASVPKAARRATPAPGPLARRTLGRTGLSVTPLAFGCMTTSDPTVVRRAADLGINHFDTARLYQNGNNERMVGAALKEIRKNVVISSKSTSRTKAERLADLDKSLSELGTDYLDVWSTHRPTRSRTRRRRT